MQDSYCVTELTIYYPKDTLVNLVCKGGKAPWPRWNKVIFKVPSNTNYCVSF